jgi:hypothetical protein
MIARALTSAFVLAALLLAAPAARADPIACDVDALKTAIDDANLDPVADTIELPAGCTFTLTTVDNSTLLGPNGLPIVETAVTIEGNGATLRRDGAAPAMRLFELKHGAALTLEDLTLTGAMGDLGGAILASCGSPRPVVVLRRTVFRSNNAAGGAAVFGCPAITVDDSLFVGNAARQGGGAMTLAGPGGEITNTTFAGNVADGLGGGAVHVDPGVPVALRNVTVVGNSAATAGGGVVGTILQNSIVASNTPDNCAVAIDAVGRNLAFPASDTSCQDAEVSGPFDYVTGDPRLQALGDYRRRGDGRELPRGRPARQATSGGPWLRPRRSGGRAGAADMR